MAGTAGLAIVGGIGKMVRDMRACQQESEKPRERWDRPFGTTQE
jgi:hypothetical protein